MIDFITGGAGSGKSYILMQKIKDSIIDNRDICVIVPEQFSHEFDKKLYKHIGANLFNQIETHSFTSLSRAIFQKLGTIGEGCDYINDYTKTAIIFQAIQKAGQSEKSLNFFEKQYQKQDFLDEVSKFIQNFRRCGITASELYDKTCDISGRLKYKLLDLIQIYKNYEILLEEYHFKDSLTDITEAAAIANGNDYFLGKTFFIDEFESFTEDEYDMLQVIIDNASDVFITLRTEDKNSMDSTLFDTVNRTMYKISDIAKKSQVDIKNEICETLYRFEHDDLCTINKNIFRSSIIENKKDANHFHIFEAHDPIEEVEYVCATICHLLRKNNDLHCGDITILTPELSSYKSILENSFERYSLPYHIDLANSVAYTPFMVYITTIIALVERLVPDTELLFRYAKTGFSNCDLISMSNLENYCYIWEIDGRTWLSPFTVETDEYPELEETRIKLLEPIQHLKNQCKLCKTSYDFCSVIYKFLELQEIDKKMQLLLEKTTTEVSYKIKQEFEFVWNQLIEILDIIVELYKEKPIKQKEFFSILLCLLKKVEYAIPPRTLDAVFVGQTKTSRLSSPKVTFILGANEGLFPSSVSGAGLFSEKERLQLEDIDIIVSKSPQEYISDEKLAVYKTLSSASHDLYLTYPLSNVANEKILPSLVVSQALSFFNNSNEIIKTKQDIKSDYYAVTLQAAYYHYVRNFSKMTKEISAMQYVLSKDEVFKERIAYLNKIHSDLSFKIEDSQLVEKLFGRTITLTPSKIEQYQLCPFKFYCENGLKLYYRQKVKMRGFYTGNMIHFCLQRILSSCTKEQFILKSPTELYDIIINEADNYWQSKMGGNFSKNYREQAEYQHTVEGMYNLILHIQSEFVQSEFYPAYLELQISNSNKDFPALKIHTGKGKIIQIAGIVDRVDICNDGDDIWVRVVDYKTGTKKFSLGNVFYGLDLQMLIYLFVITMPNTLLSKAKPAGVLYMPAGKINCDIQRGSNETKESYIEKSYKMNGLILDNPHLIELMDKSESGIYIPAKSKSKTSDNYKSGNFLTEKQMKNLHKYITNKLIEASEEIYSGKFDANPLITAQRDVCEFCTYSEICGNSSHNKCRLMEGKDSDRQKAVIEELDKIDK